MNRISRRWFLRFGAALGSAEAILRPFSGSAEAAAERTPRPLGTGVTPYGDRARFEKETRFFPRSPNLLAASSRTPLQDSHGIITPSSLHFERHHAGVPAIDPAAHRLLIHGLVDRPLVLTMDEIKRLPSVSRIYFLECSGNSGSEWRPQPETDVQRAHGLASCSEWTGVPLSVVLREVGVQPAAKWIVAEGGDAAEMTRSVPIAKARDDALLAYGQNGEALRPEQGYPLRLLLPGWEGNINVKWLARLKIVDKPYYTRWETATYSDLMPDGSSRIFTYAMDAKSIITRPSGGQKLPGAGVYELTGLAWSGRGAIRRVEVTTDGGKRWQTAELQAPVLPKAFTRFRLSWSWDGLETILRSRCTDDTGYVQPSHAELIAVRGLNSAYHNNGIQSWKVMADGTIQNAAA